MSTAPAQASLKPSWSRYWPSQAGWVAAGVGAVLLILFMANWAAYRNQPQRVAWSDYMQWPQYIAVFALWIIICAMTYWLVRMWNEELPTDDVELESAWQAGMKSLRNRGKSLQQMPLFVVLGACDRQHQQQLLDQSGQSLLDSVIPAEPDAPLHWAFTDRGVWLFVHSAGTYCKLANSPVLRSGLHVDTWSIWPELQGSTQASTQSSTQSSTQVQPTQASSDDHPHCQPLSLGSSNASHPQVDLDPSREVAIPVPHDQFASVDLTGGNPPANAAAPMLLREPALAASGLAEQPAAQQLDDLEELLERARQEESPAAAPKSGPNPLEIAQPEVAWQTELALQAAAQPSGLSSTEIAREQHALREVCRRLRNERGSIAPANGVVVLASCPQLMSGCVRASELGLALRSDLRIIQDTWQLQAPISILIDGVECLPGASELIRRGGPEQAQADSVGASYPIRYQPEKPLLETQCQLAIGQIESRIYRQLSAANGLEQVGNHQLFQLLTACRGRLIAALKAFTSEAVGLEYQATEASEPVLFTGLHFMATGQKATQQAWIKSAFAEVWKAQSYLRWTKERVRSDQRHKLIISVLKAVCVVLVVTMTATLWWVG